MVFWKKPLWWCRIACVLVTGAALAGVSHRLNLDVLAHTLRTMHTSWFLAAVAVYGLLFLPAAGRWHLVLRLTGRAINPAVTARLTLVGHFFYTLLMGNIGGDTAKAAVYARWNRLPLTDILATAPLDRLLGLMGLACLVLLILGVAALTGGLPSIHLSTHGLGTWVAGITAIGVACIVVGMHPKLLAPLKRFWTALTRGANALMKSPRTILCGTLYAFLVQIALSAVLALNLQAVSHSVIPWQKLLWTFPVIVAVSGLPLSVAGLGTRESAAIVLLGIYGVSSAEAVAVSLLTLVAALVWAIFGAVLLWQGEKNIRTHDTTIENESSESVAGSTSLRPAQ